MTFMLGVLVGLAVAVVILLALAVLGAMLGAGTPQPCCGVCQDKCANCWRTT
jgi:hypothetical protein